MALDREVEGDLILGDMGQGIPFRPGTFDGCIRYDQTQLDSPLHDVRIGQFPKNWFLHSVRPPFDNGVMLGDSVSGCPECSTELVERFQETYHTEKSRISVFSSGLGPGSFVEFWEG